MADMDKVREDAASAQAAVEAAAEAEKAAKTQADQDAHAAGGDSAAS